MKVTRFIENAIIDSAKKILNNTEPPDQLYATLLLRRYSLAIDPLNTLGRVYVRVQKEDVLTP